MPRMKPVVEEEERVEGGGKKALPEVLETELDSAALVVLLLEEGAALKKRLDEKVADEEYDPGVHIARRLKEIKAALTEIQAEEGLEGLRHNDIVFAARLQAGKTSIDHGLFVRGLIERGVKLAAIEAAEEKARKTGSEYWVRELKEL